MNVLFSTTKQWNPGDEIIYRGIRNILQDSGKNFGVVPWNRHPGIRPGNLTLDNSFDEGRHNFKHIDFIVHAGSPEWLGPRAASLHTLTVKYSKPCAFIGIGTGNQNLVIDSTAMRVLRDFSQVIICRDQTVFDILSKFDLGPKLMLLPCPSIFHCRTPLERNDRKIIGINYQTSRTKWHTISEEVKEKCLSLYKEIIEKFEVRIICNYIDEFDEACSLFDPAFIRYSSDVDEFESFFKEVDVLIGTRVHGCLGAFGTGAPAMLLDSKNDLRRQGAGKQITPLLKGDLNDLNGILKLLDQIDIKRESRKVISWIEENRLLYIKALSGLPMSRNVNGNAICKFKNLNEARLLVKKDRVENIFRYDFLIYLLQTAPYALRERIRQYLRF